MSKVLDLARKYGKSEAEVAAYSGSTGPVTANDLAVWGAAGVEIAGLTDAPTAPGQPAGTPTGLSVALTWTAATRGSTYQIRTIFMNGLPNVDSAYASGTTGTVVVPSAGTYQFQVRAMNVDGVVGPWSTKSSVVMCTAATRAAKKFAVKKTTKKEE